jgi:curli biogenesis system outer membrane secretion channel CsgG
MLITHLKRLLVMIPILFLASCATETSNTVAPKQVTSAGTPYSGPKNPISVGKFDNRSTFLRGLFSDGVDRLGSQAKTILVTHLQQSNRFVVLDRENMTEIQQEAKLRNKDQKLKGAQFVLTG